MGNRDPKHLSADDPTLRFLDELARNASSAPLHDVLKQLVTFTTSIVKSDSCFVYLREGEELVLRASKNPRGEIVDRLKVKLGEGITGWVAENRKPVAIGVNASTDPRFKAFTDLPEDHFESFLSVPIVTRGRVVGVINLQNRKPHRHTRREITLISTIGAMVGAEIEMARLETEKAVDATERRKAEDRFYKAFNANPEPITIASISEERYIDVNESFLQVTGYKREEVIGRTSVDLKFWKNPEDRVKLFGGLKEQGRVRDLEITFHTRSGKERTGLTSVETIELGGEKCVLAMMRDITDRKVLEWKLRQAQKMEAIGQLTGGIAHDFNNLLGIIIGYTDLLMDQDDAEGRVHKYTEKIQLASNRAATLVRQLLAFSRQQVVEMKVLDLNAVVSEMAKMLPRLIGKHIELRTSLGHSLGRVRADSSQIEQIVLNLAVNARDAMPDGGTLLMETSNIHVDDDYTSRHPPMTPGEYVMLVVSDTGTGMDAQTQTRIFEPFFTTKAQGKGTGLGLATVYGSVKQSSGYIWVESEPDRGTTFRVFLPLVKESVQKAAAADSGPKAPTRGWETILLVEDEESLRSVTRSFLEESGYKVLEAGTGNDALDIVKRHDCTIHLVLTDIVMPGMNGRALAEKVGTLRPDVEVVYMSGYTGFHDREAADPGLPMIPKPFTREILLRKLREVLTAEKQLGGR